MRMRRSRPSAVTARIWDVCHFVHSVSSAFSTIGSNIVLMVLSLLLVLEITNFQIANVNKELHACSYIYICVCVCVQS
jgi:hypothetical protein